MRASRLWRPISRLWNVLEGSIKAPIENFDVNFHFSNEGIYILDVELRYVVLKNKKSAVFPIKEKCLWRVLSWLKNVLQKSRKSQIEGLEVNFHNVSWKKNWHSGTSIIRTPIFQIFTQFEGLRWSRPRPIWNNVKKTLYLEVNFTCYMKMLRIIEIQFRNITD